MAEADFTLCTNRYNSYLLDDDTWCWFHQVFGVRINIWIVSWSRAFEAENTKEHTVPQRLPSGSRWITTSCDCMFLSEIFGTHCTYSWLLCPSRTFPLFCAAWSEWIECSWGMKEFRRCTGGSVAETLNETPMYLQNMHFISLTQSPEREMTHLKTFIQWRALSLFTHRWRFPSIRTFWFTSSDEAATAVQGEAWITSCYTKSMKWMVQTSPNQSVFQFSFCRPDSHGFCPCCSHPEFPCPPTELFVVCCFGINSFIIYKGSLVSKKTQNNNHDNVNIQNRIRCVFIK